MCRNVDSASAGFAPSVKCPENLFSLTVYILTEFAVLSCYTFSTFSRRMGSEVRKKAMAV